MIEKLKNKLLNQIFVDKINELVDFANKLRKELDDKDDEIRAWISIVEGLRRSIQELEDFIYTPHNEAPDHVKNIPDPYEKQREWIGHLVEYGNADDGFQYGILTDVSVVKSDFPFTVGNNHFITDVWLPDESVFYKKDK